MASKQELSCQVCGLAQHRYKCPKCQVKYCSLPCFKRHKEANCMPNNEPPRQPDHNLAQAEDKGSDDDMPQLSEEMLSRLNNPETKMMLQHSQLRKLLKAIDSAPNRHQALGLALKNDPEFISIADHLLYTTQYYTA
eukprot:c4683_g1_i2.p1 GENE.c4683_g1_i2~~c4683_g1_i2.p1  ORF type:complete len:149 (-),score=28.50 c4683_g1_i2:82-492(-)